jgi:hypothetical protein
MVSAHAGNFYMPNFGVLGIKGLVPLNITLIFTVTL